MSFQRRVYGEKQTLSRIEALINLHEKTPLAKQSLVAEILTLKLNFYFRTFLWCLKRPS